MTYKIFNRSLHFGLRNGVGFDLEFADGKAVWVSKNGGDLETAAFVGVVVMLPFTQISFGNCYLDDEA